MSSTPDPRYGAVLEILTRFIVAPPETVIGPYVDELLASVDSFDRPVTGLPDVDEAYLRTKAVEHVVNAGLGFGGAGDLARAASTILDFLRDGTAPSDPNLGQAAKGQPAVRASTEGDGGAPDELHALLDFIWSRTTEEASGLVSLQGATAQREAESYLVEHGGELLRWEQQALLVAQRFVAAARAQQS